MNSEKSKKRLLKNIISLLILQGSNYVFPLLTFPFLVRSLGVEKYGTLILGLALMQFLNVFVDYGFNISATRSISIVKDDRKIVNAIYNKIMSIKIILTSLLVILWIIIVGIIPFFENKLIFIICLLIIIGNTLFPIWLFQGLEKMSYITNINIIVKFLVTLLIIIFIQTEEDLYLAMLFQTFYYLIPGIISIYFIKIKLRIKFSFIKDINILVKELIEGRHIFATNLWINFYVQGPAIILGLLSGNLATGNFGIGQKIQGAFSGLVQPFSQAIYPYICEQFEKNKLKFLIFTKKLVIFTLIFSTFLGILTIVFSSLLVYLVTGDNNSKLDHIVKLFSFVIVFSILNTILARIIHAMNLSKILNKSYAIAASFFVVCSIPLTINYSEIGMILSVILAEGTVVILNLINVYKKVRKLRLELENS